MKLFPASLPRPAAFASAALLCGALTSLPAAVVTWNAAGATTPIGAGFDSSGVWLNFFTGSVTTLNSGDPYPPYALGQFQLNYNGASQYVNIVNQTPFFDAAQWVTVGNGPARLAPGEIADGFDTFTDDFTILASNDGDFGFYNSFDDLGTGYIGVSFTNSFVETLYGYIEVTVNPDYTFTVSKFAYETVPGAGIAIPEPSTYAALAGVAMLGFAALRRRR